MRRIECIGCGYSFAVDSVEFKHGLCCGYVKCPRCSLSNPVGNIVFSYGGDFC